MPARLGRGLAEASSRRQNVLAQKQSDAHKARNYIKLLLQSQQGSTPNEFRTLLPCQNFRPQLAQRDGLQAGFESFKAMDCGNTKMCQNEARLEASKRLEAGFEAGPGGLGKRNCKMVEIRGPVLVPKNIKKGT